MTVNRMLPYLKQQEQEKLNEGRLHQQNLHLHAQKDRHSFAKKQRVNFNCPVCGELVLGSHRADGLLFYHSTCWYLGGLIGLLGRICIPVCWLAWAGVMSYISYLAIWKMFDMIF